MDNLSKAQRRKNMQNIRSLGTLPEKKLAQSLRKCRIYFAQNVLTLPGKPDFVFRRKKIAVFVDSDFWHRHPKRFVMPLSNLDYWKAKIERNVRRDKVVNALLKKSGWTVLRLWEYEIKKNAQKCAAKVLKALNGKVDL